MMGLGGDHAIYSYGIPCSALALHANPLGLGGDHAIYSYGIPCSALALHANPLKCPVTVHFGSCDCSF